MLLSSYYAEASALRLELPEKADCKKVDSERMDM